MTTTTVSDERVKELRAAYGDASADRTQGFSQFIIDEARDVGAICDELLALRSEATTANERYESLNSYAGELRSQREADVIALNVKDDELATLRREKEGMRSQRLADVAALEVKDRHLEGYRNWQDTLVGQARDAERYRWLRDPYSHVAKVIDKVTCESPRGLYGEFNGYEYEYRSGDELDAAIDAQLAAAPPTSATAGEA